MTFVGNALLVLSAAAALYGAVAFIISAPGRRERLAFQARWAAFLACAFMTLALGLLLLAFIFHDFSLSYEIGRAHV